MILRAAGVSASLRAIPATVPHSLLLFRLLYSNLRRVQYIKCWCAVFIVRRNDFWCNRTVGPRWGAPASSTSPPTAVRHSPTSLVAVIFRRSCNLLRWHVTNGDRSGVVVIAGVDRGPWQFEHRLYGGFVDDRRPISPPQAASSGGARVRSAEITVRV